MRRTNWDFYQDDEEIISYLKKQRRYKNTALKSLFHRSIFFVHLLFCKITGKEKPLFVVLVTNNNCNLDCTYCYGEYGKRGAKNNYSTKKLLEMIDELQDLGCKLLTIHGGEALLRKDIGEILNYCKLRGFYVSLNTNGYLVPKRIEEIACVDTIIFSLDGRKESNDRNRGAGTFQKVMDGIAAAQEKGLPTVISATLTAYNEAKEDMEFLAKLGKEKGIRIQYSLLYNHDKLAGLEGYEGTLNNSSLRESVQKIKNLKLAGYPIYYADRVLDVAIEWPEVYETQRTFLKADLPKLKGKKMIPCYHGKLKYQIDADGRVVRCWALDKKDAPNIKTLGMEKALKACNTDDDCKHCAYLANNEHNAMMDLDVKSLLHVASIQIVDAMKIGANKAPFLFKKTQREIAPEAIQGLQFVGADESLARDGCKKN